MIEHEINHLRRKGLTKKELYDLIDKSYESGSEKKTKCNKCKSKVLKFFVEFYYASDEIHLFAVCKKCSNHFLLKKVLIEPCEDIIELIDQFEPYCEEVAKTFGENTFLEQQSFQSKYFFQNKPKLNTSKVKVRIKNVGKLPIFRWDNNEDF